MTEGSRSERDWESMARQRLERVVAASVARLRATADQIEQEAARDIADAAARRYDWSSYSRVAGQVVNSITWDLANLKLSNLIDAAADADAARAEKVSAGAVVPVADAFRVMLNVAQGWAEGAADNDVASDVRDAKPAEEQTFTLADIRRMVQDAARESGLPETSR